MTAPLLDTSEVRRVPLRLCPPPPTPFVGRSQALDQLAMAIGRRQRVLICGQGPSPGLGRSALARVFAHAMRDAFAEGVLWLNARVFDPYQLAVQIARALQVDLLSLAPAGDGRAALERLLSGRRILIVLDDLVDARLLSYFPNIGPSLVCTGDDPNLARAARLIPVSLTPFSPPEAEALIQAVVGLERWKLEPVAARELSGMLQHHPLSLRLALGGLNQETLPSGPLFSLLVRELRTRLGQVSHLGGERRWVMAAAGLCTARLSENALQVGRAAAVLPTAGFSDAALAAVLGQPVEELQPSLQALLQAGLLTSLEHGASGPRWAVHPILVPVLEGGEPVEELRARAAGFYLSQLLSHAEQLDALDPDIDGILASMSFAMEQGEAGMVKDFALALGPYFDARGYLEEVPRRLHMGLAAARHARDPRAEGRLNRWLGRLFLRRGAAEAARERLEAAASLAAEHQDRSGRVACMLDLARVEASLNHLEPALTWLEQALTLTKGRLAEEGYVLLELARVLIRLERQEEALKSLEAALAWARKRKDKALELEVQRLQRALGVGLEDLGTAAVSARDTGEVMTRLSQVIERLPGARRPELLEARPASAASAASPSVSPEQMSASSQEPSPDQTSPLERLHTLLQNASAEEAQSLLEESLENGEPPVKLEAAELLAAHFMRLGRLREAESAFGRAAELALRQGFSTRAAASVEQAGRLMSKRGQTDVAMRYLERAFQLREHSGDALAAQRTLNQLGQVAVDNGDYDTAFYHFMRGLDRSEGLSDASARAEALFRLGIIFSARGDDGEALSHFDMAEEIWLESRDLQGIAAVMQARARVFVRQNRRDDAQKAYVRSIELAEGLQDERLKAAGLHQLGLLLAEQGQYLAATDAYRRSLQSKRQLNDLRGMAITLHAMAQLEATYGKLNDARVHYERVLEIARDLGAPRLQAATLRALGDVQTAAGEAEQALSRYEQAQKLLGPQGEKRERLTLLLGRAGALTELGRCDEALQELQAGLELARALQDRRSEAALLYQQGLTLAELGQDEQAIGWLQKSFELDETTGNARGAAMTLAMLGQLLHIVGATQDSRVLLEEAARRMETLQMAELSQVQSWLTPPAQPANLMPPHT
ncbi:MAG: tetratricopeptide repeat protein [Myxococcota bacterium]